MRLANNPSYKHKKEHIELFRKLKASIYYKDHTSYSPEKLKNLLEIVNKLRKFRLKSESIRWITKFVYELNLTTQAVEEDYLPNVLEYQINKDKLKPLFEYDTLHDLFLDLEKDKSTSVKVNEKDYGIIYSDNELFIAVPETVEASQMLGKGTSWCTAKLGDENRYDEYILNNRIELMLNYVIFLNKSEKDRYSKICIGSYIAKRYILSGMGITVDSKNSNLYDEQILTTSTDSKTLKEALGNKYEVVTKAIMDNSEKTEIHPYRKRMQKIVTDKEKFSEELSKRGLEDYIKHISNLEDYSPRPGNNILKNEMIINSLERLFLLSGMSNSNIKESIKIIKRIGIDSRDFVTEFIKKQSEDMDFDDVMSICDRKHSHFLFHEVFYGLISSKNKELRKEVFDYLIQSKYLGISEQQKKMLQKHR